MMDSYYSFLGQPGSQTSHQKVSRSSTRKSYSFNMSTSSQQKRSIDSDYTTLSRDEKADLIAAKSKIAKLEGDLYSIKNENKVLNELEVHATLKKGGGDLLREQEECDSLRKKIKQIIGQKETLDDQLAKLQKKYDDLKTEYSNQGKVWHLEKVQVNDRLEKVKSEQAAHQIECSRQATNLIIYKSKFEESDAQLQNLLASQSEIRRKLEDYSELKHRCEIAECRVQEFQEQMSRIDESSLLMQRSQSELAKFRELQKENKKIKEDNQLYRDSAENSLILQEKVKDLEEKLTRSKAMVESLGMLELENQSLKTKIKKWESPDIFGGESKIRSPTELTRMIAELQQSQLSMVEKQAELEAKVSIKDTSLISREDVCARLKLINKELKMKNEQLEDQCMKLQRRFTLVSSDRDGLRRVLSSYENEDNSCSKVQLQEAEEKISQFNIQVANMENELKEVKQEATTQKVLYTQLQQEYEKLELAAEHRESQGSYNLFKTKVLHLAKNPLQLAREKYIQDFETVRKENEKLRKKLLQLQQEKQEEADESMNISRLIKSSKPMEEAMMQLEAEKLKSKRLLEQFTKIAKDYREAVYHVFGYTFKNIKDGTYRAQSMYSEQPDDFFIFMCAKNKDGIYESGMGETAYTREWMDAFKEYIEKGDSIPAFLANVTLELFGRTTQTEDSS